MGRKILALPLAAGLLILGGCGGKVIGEIHGAEWETIVVDGVTYARVSGSGVTAADQGDYLGKVTDGGKTTFRVYAVKGDEEGIYRYCAWDWEGWIYQRVEE